MIDDTDIELTVTPRRVFARCDGVALSLPRLPGWMPAALGVPAVAMVHFAPAHHRADLRTDVAAGWVCMTQQQQAVLARWIRSAVAALERLHRSEACAS